jgi:integrase/recombinase XerC
LRRQCRTPEEAILLEGYYFTGLRLRELLGLRNRHVDLEARTIAVHGKGEKDRTVVFPPRLQALLCPWMRGGPEDWLLPSPRHSCWPRGTFWAAALVARLGQEAGLPYRLTPHLLRHGFVRLCKVRGLPLEIAAKLLGHARVDTTSRLYGRVDATDLLNAYDGFLKLTP